MNSAHAYRVWRRPTMFGFSYGRPARCADCGMVATYEYAKERTDLEPNELTKWRILCNKHRPHHGLLLNESLPHQDCDCMSCRTENT